jgi:hypothetical protein
MTVAFALSHFENCPLKIFVKSGDDFLTQHRASFPIDQQRWFLETETVSNWQFRNNQTSRVILCVYSLVCRCVQPM